MAEFAFTLEASPALGGVDVAIGDIRIRERSDLAIVSVATPLGGEDALGRALRTSWALDMPPPGQSLVSGDTRAVRTSPDQMLLVFPHATPDAGQVVQAKLSGTGYTTDQTDNRVILEVSGMGVEAAMERLSPVDLSLTAFQVNATAQTVMEHIGALIVRIGQDSLLLVSARSSAPSFLHAVETSARYVQD